MEKCCEATIVYVMDGPCRSYAVGPCLGIRSSRCNLWRCGWRVVTVSALLEMLQYRSRIEDRQRDERDVVQRYLVVNDWKMAGLHVGRANKLSDQINTITKCIDILTKSLKAETCPGCGLPVRFDTEHEPNAWRHTDTLSRWCTTDGDPVINQELQGRTNE